MLDPRVSTKDDPNVLRRLIGGLTREYPDAQQLEVEEIKEDPNLVPAAEAKVSPKSMGSKSQRQKPESEKRKCSMEGCQKLASRKGTQRDLCIAHGGGRRCIFDGCTRTSARTGDRPERCLLHGGGKRCSSDGCSRLAVSPTLFCKAHGGGKRCANLNGCEKAARWPSGYCIFHGGGQRCKRDGCNKLAKAKGGLCISHSRMMPTIPDEVELA